MVQIESLNSFQNSFSFDIKTSSGDHISLSMMDNKELDFNEQRGENWQKDTLSLKHEIGYSFHYDGNGIDAKDKKEIEDAMKLIRPIYQKFLENIKKDDKILEDRYGITNSAQLIKSKLPKLDAKDSKLLLKDKTLDLFDKMAKEFKRGQEIIENTKKLFDKIFKNFDGFEVFA